MPTDPTFVSTLTEIANLALQRLGEPEQNLLTNDDITLDDTVHAAVVRRLIYPVIRGAQTYYRWDVLFKSVTLTDPTDLTEDENYVWAYSYDLPDDFLAPLWTDEFEYEIEGNKIYCDIQDELVRFRYIRYSLDPSEWPQTLIDIVWYKLALALCMPITENDAKYNAIITEYRQVVLPEAERIDAYGKKQPNSRYKRLRYATARGRGRRYGPDDRRQF
jgi:hypothetical protein